MGKRASSGRRSARRWASILGAIAAVAAVLAVISGPTSSAAATRPAPPTGFDAAGILRRDGPGPLAVRAHDGTTVRHRARHAEPRREPVPADVERT